MFRFEIAYNHYHNRLGDALPDTLNWLNTNIRAQALPVDHPMMVFETLSHGADAGTGEGAWRTAAPVRSLASAALMMEENPNLLNLRLLSN